MVTASVSTPRSDIDICLQESGIHAKNARHGSAPALLAFIRGVVDYIALARLSINVSCAARLGSSKMRRTVLVYSHCCDPQKAPIST
eukprot:5003718-Pleurochrysis_carterae.AAC.1